MLATYSSVWGTHVKHESYFFGCTCSDLAVFQIHQAAMHSVMLPTTVIAACKVTNQDSESGLSKKCQVQAHIALTNAGSIPKDSARQAVLPLTLLYVQISQIAAIHSITLET